MMNLIKKEHSKTYKLNSSVINILNSFFPKGFNFNSIIIHEGLPWYIFDNNVKGHARGDHIYFAKIDFATIPLLGHEICHVKQTRKVGKLVFLIRYLFEYLFGLIKYHNHTQAYLNISYEVEAHTLEREIKDKYKYAKT